MAAMSYPRSSCPAYVDATALAAPWAIALSPWRQGRRTYGNPDRRQEHLQLVDAAVAGAEAHWRAVQRDDDQAARHLVPRRDHRRRLAKRSGAGAEGWSRGDLGYARHLRIPGRAVSGREPVAGRSGGTRAG